MNTTNAEPHVRARRKTSSVVFRLNVLLVVAAGACGGDPTGTTPSATRIVITPAAVTLDSVGASAQLTAVVFGSTGPSVSVSPDWASANPAVATVSQGGSSATVVARGVGTTQVTATADGVTASVPVAVVLPPARATITPTALQMEVGATANLVATLLTSSGQAISGAAFTWTSSAPANASVDGTGMVQALQVGTATVTAESSGFSATSQITVVAQGPDRVEVQPATARIDAGGQLQFSATVFDANDTELPGWPVTWSVVDAGVATIDASGLLTGLAAGTTTVRATASQVEGAATVTVNPPPPRSSLVDDFENGSLANWTVGGRRLGTDVTDVEQRNGSAKAHLRHVGFTEVEIAADFVYGPGLRIAFEMETLLSPSLGATSSFYAAAGALISFLDADSNVLGWIWIAESTSSWILQACTDATCVVNRTMDSGPTLHDFTGAALLSQITIDESAIAFVRVAFRGYGSAVTGSLYADLWFDDFRYESSGW